MPKSKAGRKLSKPPSSHGSKRAKKTALLKGSFPPPPSENEIHLKACQWLRKEIKGLLIFHVPNGEHRHIAVAQKLQRMGVLPGVADFLCFTPSRKIAIELKNEGGEQRPEQIKFEKRWTALGGEYHLCRTLDSFKQLVTGIMLFYG